MLAYSNKPIDFITLKQALNDRAQLDEIGGPEYLSDLFSFVPSAANADYYIDIIREKYLLRQMIMTCNRVVSDCYDHREEVDALLDRVEQQIFSLTNYNVQIDLRPTKELVMDAIQEIEQLYENRGSITGLPTGFVELDSMTSGLHPAEMIVIAARPSMGKTAFAMNVAEHVALHARKAVAVCHLQLIRSATRPFCSLFVQQMRSCSAAESVHQTRGLQRAARLPFPREWLANRFGPGAEIDTLNQTQFLQFDRAANEGVTC